MLLINISLSAYVGLLPCRNLHTSPSLFQFELFQLFSASFCEARIFASNVACMLRWTFRSYFKEILGILGVWRNVLRYQGEERIFSLFD